MRSILNNTVSFMTANYVARVLDYNMTRGWGQGDKATQAYFKPIETFGPRFEETLRDIVALGFDALDLWTGYLNYEWVTDEHIAVARGLLQRYNLQVVSLAGWFGSTAQEFETTCRMSAELGIPVLGGSTSVLGKDRQAVVDRLRTYGLKLGLENHPEKTPEELLDKMGDSEDGLIGACVDTGWFGTQGYDAAEALDRLGDRVVHVHLKDVRAVGAHDTCRFGAGVVPIERCVRVLEKQGYTGALSVEHEPELFDPTDDVGASLALLRQWLKD